MTRETLREGVAREGEVYVIRRHGAFFRPDAAGYTHHLDLAGFYSREDAEKYLHAEGVTIHPLTQYRAEADAVLAGANRLRGALSLPDHDAGGNERERCAKVAEDFPALVDMPDRVIPAHIEYNDWGEAVRRVPGQTEKRKRVVRPSDIAAAIRNLPPQDGGEVE